jgi:dolichol-phosphate mannosyltransferase
MTPRPHTGAGALVVLPTYDEVENLPIILGRLFAAVPEIDVLVVDDGSPDGTGELAERMAAADASSASARRTSRGSAGAWSAATTSSSRWTPTARTRRRRCPR